MKKSLLALAVATVAVSANAAKLAEVADELEYQTQFIRQNSEAIIQTQKATTAALKASSANTKAIHRLDRDRKRADAGTAAVAAMANIPQVTQPGKLMVGAGIGNYKGQSAVAVGLSKSSDNNRVIFKMSGSATTQGDYNIGAGIGYQW